MGKQTLIEKIKGFISKKAFKLFLWANEMTKEEYWKQIYEIEKIK